MTVAVCVGSACHLKGSYRIIELMRQAIGEHGLQDKVNVCAAFCLGRCANGVTIRVDDEIVWGVSEQNFPQVFEQYILKK
nr:(2Fe-2S) ferredoxin domain-containing protein [bacterium]